MKCHKLKRYLYITISNPVCRHKTLKTGSN